jgi:L-lactate utilization protein LutC
MITEQSKKFNYLHSRFVDSAASYRQALQKDTGVAVAKMALEEAGSELMEFLDQIPSNGSLMPGYLEVIREYVERVRTEFHLAQMSDRHLAAV